MTVTRTSSDLDAPTVTPHLARLVLTVFRSGDPGGWLTYPSSGEVALTEAFCAIDARLLGSAARGFPGLTDAIRTIRVSGGVDELTAIARQDGQG